MNILLNITALALVTALLFGGLEYGYSKVDAYATQASVHRQIASMP